MQSDGAQPARPSSGLAPFLRTLTSEGRAVISAQPLASGPDPEAQGWLAEVHSHAAQALAGDPPAFRVAVAEWAARLVYQICQFVVLRDLGEDQIAAACGAPCPEPRGPDTDWSADLLFRHLPKLHQLASHLSGGDPLVGQLKALAAAWPLSSVGVPGIQPGPLDSFIGHPALRRLYADRVLEAVDLGRLGDARLDDCLRADLGLHRARSPVLAGRLFADPAPASPSEPGPPEALNSGEAANPS